MSSVNYISWPDFSMPVEQFKTHAEGYIQYSARNGESEMRIMELKQMQADNVKDIAIIGAITLFSALIGWIIGKRLRNAPEKRIKEIKQEHKEALSDYAIIAVVTLLIALYAKRG